MTVQIRSAEAAEDVDSVRTLFHEYAGALGFDLSFQGFDEEVRSLPGEYAPPGGCLLIATDGDELLGCVALRKIDDQLCEMKRLFVRTGHRGKSTGRALAQCVMDAARGLGYIRMKLDTIASMKEAIALYRSLGFRDTQAYRYNPVPGAVFLERDL